MFEMMFDLETLDTEPSAVVLSVGAVIWETGQMPDDGPLQWQVRKMDGQFMRTLNIQSQVERGRTMSERTLLWWMQQDADAQAEAFASVRTPIHQVMQQFDDFAQFGKDLGVNAYWASPSTFDFPIWESLSKMAGIEEPWHYRQVRDVRTVVAEASYSANSHKPTVPIHGKAHQPVTDCMWQIDLLTAARNKIGRRIAPEG